MRRSNQLNPMRMLAMLAVLWAAGTWLFAAESTPPARKPQPAQATTVPAQVAASEPVAQVAQDADAKEAATNAQNSEATTSSAEDKNEEEQTAEEASAAPDESKQKGQDAKQASTADKGGTPQRFVPSEQVRADFDVSFPIDI